MYVDAVQFSKAGHISRRTKDVNGAYDHQSDFSDHSVTFDHVRNMEALLD